MKLRMIAAILLFAAPTLVRAETRRGLLDGAFQVPKNSLAVQQPPAKPRLDAHGFALPDGAIARLGSLAFVSPASTAIAALSWDGKRIATDWSLSLAGAGIHLWDADTGRIVRKIDAPYCPHALAFSKDGRLLASMGVDTTFTVWDVDTGKERWTHSTPAAKKSVFSLRFVKSDELLAIALDDCVVELWDVAKGKLAQTWAVDEGKQADLKAVADGYRFTHVSLSPSGEKMAWLAARRDEATAFIYETATGKLLRKVKLPEPMARAWLMDEGETLVSDGLLHADLRPDAARYCVVDLASGKVRFRCPVRDQPVRLVAAPADVPIPKLVEFRDDTCAMRGGDFLFTFSTVSTIRWDFKTGKKLETWPGRQRLCFSGDGRRVLFPHSRRLEVCDARLRPVSEEQGFEAPAQLRFFPDGRLVAEPLAEGIVNVWDAKQGKLSDRRRWEVGTRGASHDLLGRWRTAFNGKHAYVYDLTNDRQVCRLDGVEMEDTSAYAELCADGSRTLVFSRDREYALMSWFDSRSGRELGRHRVAIAQMFPKIGQPAMWCAENGSLLGYYTLDGRLAIVDCERGKLVRTLGVLARMSWEDANIRNAPQWWHRYTSAGLLLSYRENPDPMQGTEVCVFDVTTGHCLRQSFFKLERGDFHAAILSANARFFAVPSRRTGKILLYETASGRLRGQVAASEPIQCFDIAPDCRTLATASEDTTILLWDLHRPLAGKPPTLAKNDIEQLWQLLGDPDPLAAEPAFWALLADPDETLALLKKRLRIVPRIDAAWLRGRINALNNASFRERTAASADLVRLGALAAPAVENALNEGAASLEHKRRLEALLDRLHGPLVLAPTIGELRAIELLERIGVAPARELVEQIAAGEPAAQLTNEARLALVRWPKRSTP